MLDELSQLDPETTSNRLNVRERSTESRPAACDGRIAPRKSIQTITEDGIKMIKTSYSHPQI